MDKWKFNS
ncbi:hypothetical protein Pint_33227 [Pistacia integerrima]|uniref:Uncharacterized protein n=1 Tax=Pistacia integerrima TaxID=434235 RepID=A0ACC0X6W1_9ROSI|nr:hypothetical protein Pint_33227 [Pistacia integerrima]